MSGDATVELIAVPGRRADGIPRIEICLSSSTTGKNYRAGHSRHSFGEQQPNSPACTQAWCRASGFVVERRSQMTLLRCRCWRRRSTSKRAGSCCSPGRAPQRKSSAAVGKADFRTAQRGVWRNNTRRETPDSRPDAEGLRHASGHVQCSGPRARGTEPVDSEAEAVRVLRV
eukprot:1323726-Rhodomonas_salina.1